MISVPCLLPARSAGHHRPPVTVGAAAAHRHSAGRTGACALSLGQCRGLQWAGDHGARPSALPLSHARPTPLRAACPWGGEPGAGRCVEVGSCLSTRKGAFLKSWNLRAPWTQRAPSMLRVGKMLPCLGLALTRRDSQGPERLLSVVFSWRGARPVRPARSEPHWR